MSLKLPQIDAYRCTALTQQAQRLTQVLTTIKVSREKLDVEEALTKQQINELNKQLSVILANNGVAHLRLGGWHLETENGHEAGELFDKDGKSFPDEEPKSGFVLGEAKIKANEPESSPTQ